MSRLALLLCLLTPLAATEGSPKIPQSEVVLTALAKPVYPQLAKLARVAGDVELKLSVRPDGTVESADVVSGPAMLRQAALISAQQSKFECRNCGDNVSTFQLVYTFQLGPTLYCSDSVAKSDSVNAQTYPETKQSQNHVTLIDQPVGTCDLATTSTGKVRSVRCLYLWKCGHR